MHDEKIKRGAQEIQIARTPDGKQIAVITLAHVYSWHASKVHAIIAALREHARGATAPSADGMVFTAGDRIGLCDKPVRQSYQNFGDEPALIVDQVEWTYAMQKHEARVLADNLEIVLHQTQQQ